MSSNLKVSFKKYLSSIYVVIKWLQRSREATEESKNFKVTLPEAEARLMVFLQRESLWESANKSCRRAIEEGSSKATAS